jgi:hypothetical protein
MVKTLIMGIRNVYFIFIPLFGCQVSGVSVQRSFGLKSLPAEGGRPV